MRLFVQLNIFIFFLSENYIITILTKSFYLKIIKFSAGFGIQFFMLNLIYLYFKSTEKIENKPKK